jgi:hypothetical protein
MADFDPLSSVRRSWPVDELAEWLSLIDAMRATHGEGGAGACKILADKMLLTWERLPACSAHSAALDADLYGFDTTGLE